MLEQLAVTSAGIYHEQGHIMRTLMPASKSKVVFRIGEVHGRIAQRVKDLVERISVVDGTKTTTNLWGERWTKLIINGLVVQKGKEVGVPTPLNETITRFVKRIESGELKQNPENAHDILK